MPQPELLNRFTYFKGTGVQLLRWLTLPTNQKSALTAQSIPAHIARESWVVVQSLAGYGVAQTRSMLPKCLALPVESG